MADLGDEELARALQALDNGLRRRKTSLSMTEEFKSSRPRKPSKSDTPSKRKTVAEVPDSPGTPSTHSNSPNSEHHQDTLTDVLKSAEKKARAEEPFCLACGKTMFLVKDADAHASKDRDDKESVVPSKENHLFCQVCLTLYALPPFEAAHAVIKASPSHRCEGYGCGIAFLSAATLEDHLLRVHGVASRSTQ